MNNRQTELLQKLRDGGCPAVPELIESEGYSPNEILSQSAGINRADVMELVLHQYNADPNAVVPMFNNTTPLLEAAGTGAARATSLLLEHGADPDLATQGARHITPLWEAAQHGHLRVLSILLDAGANIDVMNGAEHTALYMACQNGHLFVAMELLRRGADPNLGRAARQDGFAEIPFAAGVLGANPEIVAMLINHGASDIDIPKSIICLMQMQQTKKNCMTGREKPVTSDVLQHLQDMILLKGATVEGGYSPGSIYELARTAERMGQYRSALAMLSAFQTNAFKRVGHPPVRLPNAPLSELTAQATQQEIEKLVWPQALYDLRRLQDAVYGIKNSDGRMSSWQQHVFEEQDQHPDQDLFYGWARHGDTIYRHGGRTFLNHTTQVPTEEKLYAFDLIAMKWRRVKTTGSSPGPRSEHCVFVYKDALFVIGGRGPAGPTCTSMKLYKLDLNSFVWSVVATKGGKPGPRDEAAVCVYKDKLYMHGGEDVGAGEFLSQLWSLDLKTFKWNLISSRGNTARKAHCAWAAKGKIYVYGGTAVVPPQTETMNAESIRAFEKFDLQSKEWEQLFCAGDDPWPLAEYCCLPLYGGTAEPHAIIIFGGYREMGCHGHRRGPEDPEEWKAKYGDEWEQFGLPYRRRLLRLDLDTLTWTRLQPTSDNIMPRAQCFAAEMSTSNDITTLVIGGGYGLSHRSRSGDAGGSMTGPIAEAIRETNPGYFDSLATKSMKPEISYDLFRVQIPSGQGPSFIERARTGHGWEWDAFDSKETPSMTCEMQIWSPTLYWISDVAEDDFRDPPGGPVSENDEARCLGRRVLLHGLKARRDLNGKAGRCGRWMTESGRYTVTIVGRSKRESLAIKPANLRFAQRLSQDELVADVQRLQSRTGVVPVHICCMRLHDESPGSQLDPPRLQGHQGLKMLNDSYHGPLSGRAMSVLEYCADRKGGTIMLMRADPSIAKTFEARSKAEYYERFVADLRATDQARAEEYEANTVSRRNMDSWSDYVQLTVTLDGISPTVERTIVVSTNVTIAELHHQIFCPAIGWTSNFHAYALRRRLRDDLDDHENTLKKGGLSQDELPVHSLRILEEECWIGPNKSSALDVLFQPLYIGGALADDRKILLGDLVFDKTDKGLSYDLQYVYDYGCWWSHTIRTEPCDAPSDGSVAVLVSGKWHCPPEDTGGVIKYCPLVAKLKGLVDVEPENPFHSTFGPSSPRWWALVNEELRGKANTQGLQDPISFDLEYHRRALKEALRSKLAKAGTEHRAFITSNEMGLRSSMDGPGAAKPKVKKEVKKASQKCALCGVTVGLRLCANCKSIAFCCREHQVEYWPQHKAECKAIRKQKSK